MFCKPPTAGSRVRPNLAEENKELQLGGRGAGERRGGALTLSCSPPGGDLSPGSPAPPSVDIVPRSCGVAVSSKYANRARGEQEEARGGGARLGLLHESVAVQRYFLHEPVLHPPGVYPAVQHGLQVVDVPQLAGALDPLVVLYVPPPHPVLDVLVQPVLGDVVLRPPVREELQRVERAPPVPAPQEQAGDHDARPALPSLAVHRDGVLTVPRHPGAGLLAHEDELREEGGRVVFEGNALNLVEEQLGMVVAHHAVGRVVGVAEVEDEELAVVPLGQKARDDVNVVAEGRVSSKRWSRHGDHPVGDVGQVQVVAMLLVSPLVLEKLIRHTPHRSLFLPETPPS
eukprot:768397-Hanusia_phi.AAC.13